MNKVVTFKLMKAQLGVDVEDDVSVCNLCAFNVNSCSEDCGEDEMLYWEEYRNE